jgi:hypothetical protein
MSLRFPCPTCKRELTGPESLTGAEVQCPSCRAVFLAGSSANSAPIPFDWPIHRELIRDKTPNRPLPEPPYTPSSDPLFVAPPPDTGLSSNSATTADMGPERMAAERERGRRGLIVAIIMSMILVVAGIALAAMLDKPPVTTAPTPVRLLPRTVPVLPKQ